MACTRAAGLASRTTNCVKPPNVVNASGYWHVRNKPYTIGLWGRNLSNELVYTAVSGNAVSGLSQYAPPRTYGINFSADF